MTTSNTAQTEQAQPKTINDLHKAFAELSFSYGMVCRDEQHLASLAILQADCALLASVAQELKVGAA